MVGSSSGQPLGLSDRPVTIHDQTYRSERNERGAKEQGVRLAPAKPHRSSHRHRNCHAIFQLVTRNPLHQSPGDRVDDNVANGPVPCAERPELSVCRTLISTARKGRGQIPECAPPPPSPFWGSISRLQYDGHCCTSKSEATTLHFELSWDLYFSLLYPQRPSGLRELRAVENHNQSSLDRPDSCERSRFTTPI